MVYNQSMIDRDRARISEHTEETGLRKEFSNDFNPYSTLVGGPVTLSAVAKALEDRKLYGGYKVHGLLPALPR